MNLFTWMCSQISGKKFGINSAITKKLTAKHCPPIMVIPMTWDRLVHAVKDFQTIY